jgi:Fe-S oxidoreductase
MNDAFALVRRDDEPIRRVENSSGQNVFACYQCGHCTADCPFSLSPSLVMRLMQLGRVEDARVLTTTWECASCYACETGCPKGLSPVRVIKSLQTLDGGRPLSTLYFSPESQDGRPFDTYPAAKSVAIRFNPFLRITARIRKIRANIIAEIPAALRLGSAIAPLSNFFLRFPGIRFLADRLVGFHWKRPIPLLAFQSFPRWFKRHNAPPNGRRGTVALFHDTFNDFSYPKTLIAATELLEKAGYRVELADNVCCGRPALSKGLIEKAAAAARINVPRLYRFASKGIYVVGCEPSCLLTLRDEYPNLVPEEMREMARVVASRALLIDEFLTLLKEKGELSLRFKAPSSCRSVVFHGHCHQKASADVTKSLEMLDFAGYQSTYATNAACCGMAGAHGYEKEHYELSEAAGERGVFPAVRSQPEAQVVVTGVSCRQQIEHFTGRPVKHLAEVLREAVEE